MAAAAHEAGTAEALFILSSMAMYAMVWVSLSRTLLRHGLRWWLGVPVAWCLTLVAWLLACGIAIGLGIPVTMTVVVLLVGAAALFFARAKVVPPASNSAGVSTATEPEVMLEPEPAHGPVLVANEEDRNADGLIRLVEGMMADGMFVQAEADYLFSWLSERRERLDQHPFAAIYRRLKEALADGVLDEDEAADLAELFQRLVLNESDVVAKIAPPALPRQELAVVAEAPVSPVPIVAASVAPKPKATRSRAKRVNAGIDRVVIRYEDSLGFESEREVTVKHLDDLYLKGFCHVRNAIRTFRVDRIGDDVIRPETGEVLSLNDWLREHHV